MQKKKNKKELEFFSLSFSSIILITTSFVLCFSCLTEQSLIIVEKERRKQLLFFLFLLQIPNFVVSVSLSYKFWFGILLSPFNFCSKSWCRFRRFKSEIRHFHCVFTVIVDVLSSRCGVMIYTWIYPFSMNKIIINQISRYNLKPWLIIWKNDMEFELEVWRLAKV